MDKLKFSKTPPNLPVHWTNSPVTAKAWHIWQILPTGSATETELALGWPGGSIAALRSAFEQALPRNTGWDLPPGAVAPALEYAARIYKRGVPTRTPLRQSSGSYQVEFVDAAAVREFLPNSAGYLIDHNVVSRWPDLKSLLTYFTFVVDENRKSLETAAQIASVFRANPNIKDWFCIGGGVMTDTAAFAASQVGAALTLVPTTLLSMADAAVGGKTGVNFPPYGKNQVGAFYHPARVLIWSGWLKTLPPEEFDSGAAECLKHAFVSGDAALLADLPEALKSRDLRRLSETLPSIVGVKVKVVESDPQEQGYRAVLNFGHTLGHAVETLSLEARVDPLRHGEAVAVGMRFAMLLSQRLGYLSKARLHEGIAALKSSGLLLPLTNLAKRIGGDLSSVSTWSRLSALMHQDKKITNHGQETAWVLLSDWGKPVQPTADQYTVAVSEADLKSTWDEFVAADSTL